MEHFREIEIDREIEKGKKSKGGGMKEGDEVFEEYRKAGAGGGTEGPNEITSINNNNHNRFSL